MIANCPACGTHYKHDPPAVPARGRCGRCEATVDLSRLRPYRIVAVAAPRPEDAARAARHLPIGLDDPVLATTIARNVDRPLAPATPDLVYRVATPTASPSVAIPSEDTPEERWGAVEPLPPLAETDTLAERTAESEDDLAEEPRGPEGRGTEFVLWLVTAAIVGTGASWMCGGTTLEGVVAGTILGALTGWGWLRWTSPK